MHNALSQLMGTYSTILADPPWRFTNRTGKVAPEHRRLRRYIELAKERIVKVPRCAMPKKSTKKVVKAMRQQLDFLETVMEAMP